MISVKEILWWIFKYQQWIKFNYSLTHTLEKRSIYSVIQKDGLKEPVPVVGGMAWTVNGASTHAIQLVAVSQFSARSTGCLAWATLKTLSNSSHVLLWYTWLAGAFAFTQTAYLLKLVIPTKMFFLVGGWMLKRSLNARCTAVGDSVLMNSRKQKILFCLVAF